MGLAQKLQEEQKKQEALFQKDLMLAQKLQRMENEERYDSEDVYNYQRSMSPKHNESSLPPKRRNQPVHGESHQIMTLYHVTSRESGRKIRESNKMIRGSQGMFGGGIYFAETPKDANYKAEHKGMLVTCKVYIGKCYRVEDSNGGKFTFTSLHKLGYDSVWAPNGSGKGKCERVVYNWDQVVILSVREYE